MLLLLLVLLLLLLMLLLLLLLLLLFVLLLLLLLLLLFNDQENKSYEGLRRSDIGTGKHARLHKPALQSTHRSSSRIWSGSCHHLTGQTSLLVHYRTAHRDLKTRLRPQIRKHPPRDPVLLIGECTFGVKFLRLFGVGERRGPTLHRASRYAADPT